MVHPLISARARTVAITAMLFAATGAADQAVAQSTQLVGAVLPSGRSARIGDTVTAFATMINSGGTAKTGCYPAPETNVPATFSYQRTDPSTNQPVGSVNTPVTLAAGAAQSFVMAFTPVTEFAPTDVRMTFRCDEPPAAPILPGVNTITIAGDATQQPDVIALSSTVGNTGVADIPGATGTGFFAVATVNIGSAGPITVSVDTGGPSRPVSATLCQTNPATAACLAPPSASLTRTFAANENGTFSVFLTGSGVLGFEPSTNRAFVRFLDSQGALRGATSVAMRTTGATPSYSQFSSLSIAAPSSIVAIDESQAYVPVYATSSGVRLPNPGTQWQSSNAAIATINAAGIVNPISPGGVVISAQGLGATATASARVVWAAADVDFARAVATPSASGLLLGFNLSGQPTPGDDLIAPLRPRLWRATPQSVPPTRARAVGARYNLLLSDYWGYPINGWPNGRPWENLPAFSARMTQLAQQLRNEVDIWEIWNEPDNDYTALFWDGTEQQFFTVYLEAYRALRNVLGANAVIAGPSLSNYNEGFLDRFAAFCLANGCEANALTWHGPYAKGQFIDSIPQTLLRARQRFILAPSNAALRVRELVINEFGGPADRINPLNPLIYMQALERGRADASAKSCWTDSLGQNECYNNSLDGLLASLAEPRSNWRAMVWYGQAQAGRVDSRSTKVAMLALASKFPLSASGISPPDARAQVLTGLADIFGAPASASLGLRMSGINSIPGLEGATSVRVRIYVIAPSGEAAAPAPVVQSDTRLSVSNGESVLVIDTAARSHVHQIVLSP